MRPFPAVCIVVAAFLLLEAAPAEAKRRKHKGSDHHHDQERSDPHKTKTKTKWSSSTDLAGSTQVSTEEHGYYVKRTYVPPGETLGKKRQSPPYLAIPIAWFSCASDQKDCHNSNSAAINSAAQSLNEGYLCDDDCEDLYDPICGRTSSEVAVFYSHCKLGVAKCRSHGAWADMSYAECQEQYPKETAYADKKFRASPYFRDIAMVEQQKLLEEQKLAQKEIQKVEKEQKRREAAEQKMREKEGSSESSEEKEDQKVEQQKEKPQEQKPVEVPMIPVTVGGQAPIATPSLGSNPMMQPETIALPPMPLKDATTHKPLAIALAEATPLKEQAKDNDRLKYLVA